MSFVNIENARAQAQIVLDGNPHDGVNPAALASCILLLCNELEELKRASVPPEPDLDESPKLDAMGKPWYDHNATMERVFAASREDAKKDTEAK